MFRWLRRQSVSESDKVCPRYREKNGQFKAKKDVPIWKRDIMAFADTVQNQEKKQHCKGRWNQQALINAFNKERKI